MPDYTKTIIYKLINYDFPELVYVGSTTNFTKRKYQHKSNVSNVNNPKYNLKLYVSIRENGNWESWEMIKLCDYPCNNRREAEQEEDRHMMELKANLNMYRAFRTQKQYQQDNKEKIHKQKKQYNEDNKDKIKEQTRQYRINNKDKIVEKEKQYREYNKEKIKERMTKQCSCECGSIFQHCRKARHQRSIKHQTYLNSLNQ
jgi:hypothetical protein